MNTSFLKKIIFALSAVLLVSCDKDFNEIGSDIIEDDIHHNGIDSIHAHVVAFDRPTGAVQTNNYTLNALGVYNNPAFGKTVAHFVTQVELAEQDPKFSEAIDISIDSVYLYVPYYSTLERTNPDTGAGVYTLDSVYGNPEARLKLSVYENGYYLRSADPGSSSVSQQKYFSDEKALVEAHRGESRLNNGASHENDEFVFSTAEVQFKYTHDDDDDDTTPQVTTVTQRLAPGMFMMLDKTYFRNKIINAPQGKLVNNNVFRDYFRGLYFHVEQIGEQSVMAMPRFSDGTITIIYHDHPLNGDGTFNTAAPKVRKTLTLNVKGNTINFFDNTYKPEYLAAVNTSNETTGDSRLHIKGGAGSVAFIDIRQSDLNTLKEEQTGQRVLINEANLSFFIDKTAMANATDPMRVYLYDVKNRRPIVDYFIDGTSNTVNPKRSKSAHGGLVGYDAGGNSVGYKIRLTNHINNIINKDSTNVRLALVVTENINLVGNGALKTPFGAGDNEVKEIPVSSILHPFGTILYGNTPDVPADKRLKLEIFYTKPN